MTVKISIKDAVSSIRKHLPQYLEEKLGITDPTKKFNCINPIHEDKTPSMSLVPQSRNTVIHCFGCKASYDIFDVAYLIEGLPITGTDFYTITVPKMAEKYGIEYEGVRVSESMAHSARLYKLCKYVFSYMKEYGITGHAEARGLKPHICELLGIYTIPDYNSFITTIKSHPSVSDELLREVGIDEEVFGPDKVTFTLFSQNGHPCGFIARNMNYVKGESTFPKYKTTRNTAICVKKDILYGLHLIKKDNPKNIYLMEGTFDVAQAIQKGIPAVALLGSSFSLQHTIKLFDLGLSQLTFCLDNDPAGIKGTIDTLQQVIETGQQSYTIKVKILPSEFPDPDSYFSKHTKQEFLELPEVSAFKFYLDHTWEKANVDTEEDKLSLVETLCKQIALEPSHLRRKEMISELASISDYPENDIRIQVDYEINVKKDAFQRKMEVIRKSAIKNLSNVSGPKIADALKNALKEADDVITTITKEEDNKPDIQVLELLSCIGKKEDGITESSFITTPFKEFNNVFDGIPASQKMIGLLARPSSGKSSLLSFIVPELLRLNPDLDVLFHTTDDPKEDVLMRMVASMSGLNYMDILKGRLTDKEKRVLEYSKDQIRTWVLEKRLRIRDSEHGFTTQKAEHWIRKIREERNTQKRLYVLDNMYKTWTTSNKDIRSMVENTANHIQIGICQALNCTALCTLEPRRVEGKIQSRLNVENIKETAKVYQNLHVLWILHNGMPPGRPTEIPGRTQKWVDENGIEKPVVELEIVKNKTHGPGLLVTKFDWDNYRFYEVSCTKGLPQDPSEKPAPAATFETEDELYWD